MQKKYFLPICILLIALLLTIPTFTYGQTATPSPTTIQSTPTPDNSSQLQGVKDTIKELEGKISELKGQEKSLSSDIKVMDNQIRLTELRITNTQTEIKDLEENIGITKKKISGLEGSLTKISKVLLNRIVAAYKISSTQPLQLLASSNSLASYMNKDNYVKFAQDHDKQMMVDVQQAKDDYSNQKKIFEDKQIKLESLKKQLESYSEELDAEKEKKKRLLAETQGSEANYQKLLAAAKAQLAGFSRFTASQGGASLLSGQTKCDEWGCYYSQRDTQWGGLSLNGTQYTIASDGCLVTSMAMVMTHYGRSVTPIDINSNPDNFASYYPAYLLYTIRADGVTAQRMGAAIDSTLANGDPLVVGVNAYGGTHFVVLVSGSNGKYIMHDPYIENGYRSNFTDHYTMGSIFEVHKVVIK